MHVAQGTCFGKYIRIIVFVAGIPGFDGAGNAPRRHHGKQAIGGHIAVELVEHLHHRTGGSHVVAGQAGAVGPEEFAGQVAEKLPFGVVNHFGGIQRAEDFAGTGQQQLLRQKIIALLHHAAIKRRSCLHT